MGKQNLYDHSIRVPLMLAGPGVPERRSYNGLVYQHDLHPTLLEAAGAVVPDSCEFKSLWPAMAESPGPGRESIFTAYRHLQRTAREERWKLIAYEVEGERRRQLFDLQNDPWEMTDLSADPGHADEMMRLRASLKHWQEQVGDPCEIFD
jgi:arylsulfatase A-like enzyme